MMMSQQISTSSMDGYEQPLEPAQFPSQFQPSNPTGSSPPPSREVEDDAVSSRKKQPSSSKPGPSKKIGHDLIRNFISTSRDGIDLVRTLHMEHIASMASNKIPTIKDCVDDLRQLPNVPRDTYFKALNLFIDRGNRSIYMVLNNEEKAEWVRAWTK